METDRCCLLVRTLAHGPCHRRCRLIDRCWCCYSRRHSKGCRRRFWQPLGRPDILNLISRPRGSRGQVTVCLHDDRDRRLVAYVDIRRRHLLVVSDKSLVSTSENGTRNHGYAQIFCKLHDSHDRCACHAFQIMIKSSIHPPSRAVTRNAL